MRHRYGLAHDHSSANAAPRHNAQRQQSDSISHADAVTRARAPRRAVTRDEIILHKYGI